MHYSIVRNKSKQQVPLNNIHQIADLYSETTLKWYPSCKKSVGFTQLQTGSSFVLWTKSPNTMKLYLLRRSFCGILWLFSWFVFILLWLYIFVDLHGSWWLVHRIAWWGCNSFCYKLSISMSWIPFRVISWTCARFFLSNHCPPWVTQWDRWCTTGVTVRGRATLCYWWHSARSCNTMELVT